jgi:hypothetical protein
LVIRSLQIDRGDQNLQFMKMINVKCETKWKKEKLITVVPALSPSSP